MIKKTEKQTGERVSSTLRFSGRVLKRGRWSGNSLEVQQLGLGAIIAKGKVLVLRFSPHKLLSATTPTSQKGQVIPGTGILRNLTTNLRTLGDLFFLL